MSGVYTTDNKIDLYLRPTQETYDALQRAYDFFNQRLFDGRLPSCLLSLQRKGRSYGYFSHKRFINSEGKYADEIALNPIYFQIRSLEDVLSTQVHEMVHLEQHYFGVPGRGRYHNRQWADNMKSIGLYPSNTGELGGAELGDQMSHYIIQGGRFQTAALQLIENDFKIEWQDDLATIAGYRSSKIDPSKPKQSKAGKRIKYTCAKCGLNAWAKHDAKLVCGADQTELVAT